AAATGRWRPSRRRSAFSRRLPMMCCAVTTSSSPVASRQSPVESRESASFSIRGRPMRVDADVAIVGSGFAGSLTALALTRRGKRVVFVERGRHPRFAIGESSTPLANLLLEELADAYDLPGIR